MNLDILQGRVQEIETAITNTTNQLNALHGHKAETLHWIGIIQNAENGQPQDVEIVEC